MSARRPEAGFTLIEMLVVVGIIILAAAFMIPTLGDYLRNRKISAAGNLVVRTLNEARSEAVTKRTKFTVVFLSDGMMVYDNEAQRFEGPLRRITNDQAIRYETKFSDEELVYGDMKSREEFEEELEYLDEDRVIFDREGNTTLTFGPAGTIDFGSHVDISTERFHNSELADVKILQLMGDTSLDDPRIDTLTGFVDIRPAGMIAFKIEDLYGREELE